MKNGLIDLAEIDQADVLMALIWDTAPHNLSFVQEGVVLVDKTQAQHCEFVVWHLYKKREDPAWHVETGHYYPYMDKHQKAEAFQRAVRRFHRRATNRLPSCFADDVEEL